MRRHRRGRNAGRHPESRRVQDDPVDGRHRRERQAAGRAHRQAPGDHQRREHRLRRQAPDRPEVGVRRGPVVARDHAVPDRRGPPRRRPHHAARPGVLGPRDLGLHPPGDEADLRGVPRRGGHQGRRHRAGVLQRRPASGDQGRRPDRRPRRHPHHQRADRGGARLRVRPRDREEGRGLRPRRRHVRHLDPRDRQRRVRGHLDRRRHVPRRRGLRPPRHRLAGPGLPEGAQDRPAQGQDGLAAAQGRRREGEVRAVDGARDRDQPAVHHLDRPQRGAPPPDHADPRQARGAHRRPRRAHRRDLRAHARGGRDRARRHRGGHPRRRHDPHAARPAGGRRVLRPRAVQGRPPRRGRRARRRDPGRGAHRREDPTSCSSTSPRTRSAS